MFTKTALVSALMATVAIAAPAQVKRDTGSFGMLAIHSGSDVQYGAINANSSAFYIDRDTSSSCPLSSGCPAGTSTAVTIGSTGGLSLDVTVPGGQQVYITSDGVLSFTVAHSAAIPSGAVTDGFSYTAGAGSDIGSLTHSSGGFFACPQSDSSYLVYVGASGPSADCIDIAIATEATTETAAWEYN